MACFFLIGCQTPQPRPSAPPPDAAALLHRYNARARSIQRLWAHAVVEAEWIDDQGKKQSEQGDGQLFIRKPRDLALSIGKLGDAWYWLGANAERFWWFDENPRDKRPDIAYVGRHEDLGKPGTPRLNTPVPPDQIIQLLGITELPADALSAGTVQPPKGSDAQAVWFHIPARLSNARVEQRILIGAISARPLAILFVDAQGNTIAEARLTGYKTMNVPDAPPGAWPYIATRVEVSSPQRKSKLVLFLEGVTSNEKKFKDALFDFDALVKARQPAEVRELRPEP